jgi:hypothetical protein
LAEAFTFSSTPFFSDWFARLGLGFCFLGVFLSVVSSKNLTSSAQYRHARTTTQGIGSTGELGPMAGPQRSCISGGRMYCPRPAEGLQTGVLQPLSRDPDRGNRRVASVAGAGKQPRPRGHQGGPAAKSVTSSLSSVKPLVSETAQRELWNHYPQH